MSRIIAAALAAGLLAAPALVPAPAEANTCAWRPANQHCLGRLPKSQTLDLRQPGAGGSVTCKGIPTATIQFDHFYFASAGFTYLCSADIPCSQMVGTLPYQRFC